MLVDSSIVCQIILNSLQRKIHAHIIYGTGTSFRTAKYFPTEQRLRSALTSFGLWPRSRCWVTKEILMPFEN